MVQFIVTDILMVAVGTMLYLIVMALPRIAEGPDEKETKNIFERLAHSDIPERLDIAINGFLVKFLRKVKVFVLKLDNTVSHHLKKIKIEDATAQQPAIDFTEIAGKKPRVKKTTPESEE